MGREIVFFVFENVNFVMTLRLSSRFRLTSMWLSFETSCLQVTAGFSFVLYSRRVHPLILSLKECFYYLLSILRCGRELDIVRFLAWRESTVTKAIDASSQSRVVTGLRAENSSTNAFFIYKLSVYVKKAKLLCMFLKVARRDKRNSVDFRSLVF